MSAQEHSRIAAALNELDALFAAAEVWTQHASALDAKDYDVEPEDPDAVCWCLAGGICKLVRDDGSQEDVVRALVRALGFRRWSEMTDWNDERERTFAEVKQRIADAKARLLQQNHDGEQS